MSFKKADKQAQVLNNNISQINLHDLGQYFLYDVIEETSSKEFCTFLMKANHINKDVTLFINSPGGYCSDGFAMIDMIEASRINVQTRAVGQICSMGFLLFITGQKGQRILAPNTQVMSHTFSGGVWGNSHDLLAKQDDFEQLYKRMVKHYEKHTNCTKKQIKELFLGKTDLYLTPKECLKYGIADVIAKPWS